MNETKITQVTKSLKDNRILLNNPDSQLITDCFNFKKKIKKRAEWSGSIDFFLAALGYAIGLSCIWRYPALAYRDGGGAFLVPFIVFTFLLGIPMVFLELSIGQFTSTGTLTCWKMVPLMRGIGISMNFANSIIGIYYNMIISYALYYFILSLTSKLPWSYCDEKWASPNCVDNFKKGEYFYTSCDNTTFNNTIKCDNGKCFNKTFFFNESNVCNQPSNYSNGFIGWHNPSFPSQDFWNKIILKKSDSIENSGHIVWELVLVLLSTWIIMFALIFKGIKATGKVVYFTTGFPYVVLLLMGIQGWLLDGAYEGIRYYIQPNMDQLKNIQVWQDAATQQFFTLSISYGGLLTYASYNPFGAPIFRDSIALCILSSLTSIFCGFVIFPYIGYLSKLTGLSIQNCIQNDAGLVFVVIPFAVSELKGSVFWSIIFFILLFFVGLDTMMASVETTVTAIVDIFPYLQKKKNREYSTTLAVCIIYFLIGLVFCLQSGFYWIHLFDNYSSDWGVLTICCFECITVGYLYGFEKFRQNVSLMIGDNVSFHWSFSFFKYSFQFICPILAIFLGIYSLATSIPISMGNYSYPEWTRILGILMNAFIVSGIVIFAIIKIIREIIENIRQPKDLKPELKMTICEKLLKPAESYKPREVKNQEKLKSLKLAFEQKDRASYRKFDGIIDLEPEREQSNKSKSILNVEDTNSFEIDSPKLTHITQK